MQIPLEICAGFNSPAVGPRVVAGNTSAEQLAEYKRDADHAPAIVKQMQQAGVYVLAGSDGPDPMVIPGFSLHHELRTAGGKRVQPPCKLCRPQP